MALQQAIEKAVYGLVMEGIDLNLWNFADTQAGWPMLWRYRQERDGVFTPKQVEAAMDTARKAAPMKMKPRAVPMTEMPKSSSKAKQGGPGVGR